MRNKIKARRVFPNFLIVGFLIMLLAFAPKPAFSANPKEEQEKKGIAFKAVHPLVDISTGFLLGGSNGGLWIPAEKTVPMLKDGENYQLYSARKFLGETKGKKPRSFGRPCKTYGVEFSSNPILTGGVVAVAADWPLLPRAPKFTSTKQKVYVREAARLLKNLGLQKPEVHLTSVIRVDLDGDGTEEVVASAAHEVSGKSVPSNLGSYNYSLIFLRRIVGSRVETVPLLSHVYKEDVEDNPAQKFYLSSIRINLLGIFDLNGDGRMELLVHDSYYEGDSVIVYEVDGLKANKVLVAGCAL